MQRSASISTSRGTKWNLLHSLWIGWTFLLGFFSWLAFGRGPVMESDIVEASNDAQERLQRCMEVRSFFTQYSIRLVQDFNVDRRNNDFMLKSLRLEGDGPGFPQERISFPKALPRGDLMLDQGDGNLALLYPFIVASNCPHCRYRETYFIDRWNDRKNTTLITDLSTDT